MFSQILNRSNRNGEEMESKMCQYSVTGVKRSLNDLSANSPSPNVQVCHLFSTIALAAYSEQHRDTIFHFHYAVNRRQKLFIVSIVT